MTRAPPHHAACLPACMPLGSQTMYVSRDPFHMVPYYASIDQDGVSATR